jgi:hypothetical protein
MTVKSKRRLGVMILLGLLAYVCLCVAIATVMPGAEPAAPKKAPPKTEPATLPMEWNGPADTPRISTGCISPAPSASIFVP